MPRFTRTRNRPEGGSAMNRAPAVNPPIRNTSSRTASSRSPESTPSRRNDPMSLIDCKSRRHWRISVSFFFWFEPSRKTPLIPTKLPFPSHTGEVIREAGKVVPSRRRQTKSPCRSTAASRTGESPEGVSLSPPENSNENGFPTISGSGWPNNFSAARFTHWIRQRESVITTASFRWRRARPRRASV